MNIANLKTMNIEKSLAKSSKTLKENLNNNPDLIAHNIITKSDITLTLFMIDGMTNKTDLSRFVINPLVSTDLSSDNLLTELTAKVLANTETSILSTYEECVKFILDGDAVLIIDGYSNAIRLGAKGYTVRGISEPPTSAVIKGPREGFTEDLKQNSIMLRRRLKHKDLTFKILKLGKYSQTNVFVCHIKGICDNSIYNKVLEKLSKIDIDGIIDSSYIANFLQDRQYSIFKQVGDVEKPDILASKLLEGRVAIFVDGSPIVLTVPFMLLEDYQSPQDYYNTPLRATMSRILRLVSIIICVFLPAFYVSAQIYHLQLIPLRFLTKVMGSVREIPFTPSIEMFLVVVLFEILKESSIRMPKYVGMALSVVGALVLGDTAVNSGIISTPAIMIVAISSIAMYTVPDQEGALSILRLVFLLLGACLGLMGIILGVLFLSTYLCTLSNYGLPYLAPFAPILTHDLQDGITKQSMFGLSTRPKSFPNPNKTRLKSDNDKDNEPK